VNVIRESGQFPENAAVSGCDTYGSCMPKRSLTLISLAALFGGLATIVPVAATAAPAAAAPRGALAVSSTLLDVKTSEGRHLQMRLAASRGMVEVDLARLGSETYLEEHDWIFSVAPGMRFDRTEGKGSVRAAYSDLHHYGETNLKLHQTRDWTTQDCSTGSAATTRVHIKGTVFFRTRATGAHPWGDVGTRTHPLEIDTHGRLVADNDCQQTEPAATDVPCDDEVFWTDRKLVGGSFTFEDVEHGLLAAFNFRILPRTDQEGFRLDNYFIEVPPPVFTTTETGVQVDVTTSGGRATGAATLTAEGEGTATTNPCGTEGGTVTTTDWVDATVTNGIEPLTVHPDLGAPLVAHEGTDGSIEHSTPDPAPPIVAAA
jgi:hypothetical protein